MCGMMAQRPFQGSFYSKENKIRFTMDLYAEDITVTGWEDFGPMHGYLRGEGLYGTWMVTTVTRVDSTEAVVRVSNDQGSDTQELRLLLAPNDTTLTVRLTDGVSMKRAVGKKLQKLPGTLVFDRI